MSIICGASRVAEAEQLEKGGAERHWCDALHGVKYKQSEPVRSMCSVQ